MADVVGTCDECGRRPGLLAFETDDGRILCHDCAEREGLGE